MNILKFPPLNSKLYKNIPDKLIYKSRCKYLGQDVNYATMFSTDKQNPMYTSMYYIKDSLYREGKRVPSLYILYLKSSVSGKGMGTKMLDLAKQESKNMGCNGYIHLDAGSLSDSKHTYPDPHVFYKKYGLESNSSIFNYFIQRYVNKGEKASSGEFSLVRMFYPPLNSRKSIFAKIQNFFDMVKNTP